MLKRVDQEKDGGTLDIQRWVDVLGGIIERHPRLFRKLGDLETGALGERIAPLYRDDPIFIAGLARSGSTILLELLARHPALGTHRYRDFPPIHVPYAWNWYVEQAARADPTPKERSHRDRITVTAESPEAFEEGIWMAFFPTLHDPRVSAVLDAQTRNPDFEAFYRAHIAKLLLARGRGRYLAKGNYNLTRLGYLRHLFPAARFLVPVRDPVWHVASLMKQHGLFRSVHAQDPRARNYMRRTGHFEFGLDRKPINPGAPEKVAAIERLWAEGREIEGWADYWALIYGEAYRALAADPGLKAATLVLRYEDFCAEPAATMARVLDHCGLDHAGLPEAAAAIVSAPDYYRPPFTDAERMLIRERTAETARLYGYREAPAG
jgi:hypothetical protein